MKCRNWAFGVEKVFPHGCSSSRIGFAFALLLLSFLVPHGIGIYRPFGLPSLDLVRVSLLIFHILSIAVLWASLDRDKKIWQALILAPKTQWTLIFICLWQLVSSASVGLWSSAWALGYGVMIWTLTFLAISLCSADRNWATLARGIGVLFLILAIWAWAEWVTQSRVVTWRNTWPPEVLKNSLELGRLYRTSIGPFPSTHNLALALIASAGFLLTGRRSVLASVLLSGGLLATGFVAGYIAGIVMLGLVVVARRTVSSAVVLVAFVVAVAAVMTAGGIGQPNTSAPYAHIFSNEKNLGSWVARLNNTSQVIKQVSIEAPLFGFGAGSVGDGRVHTNLHVGTDLGGWFVLLAESGFPPALVLLALFAMQAIRGWASGDRLSQGGAISIAGYSVVALSSPVLHLLPIILMTCAVIEHRTDGEVENAKPFLRSRVLE